jgi:hypothetical protein
MTVGSRMRVRRHAHVGTAARPLRQLLTTSRHLLPPPGATDQPTAGKELWLGRLLGNKPKKMEIWADYGQLLVSDGYRT